MTLGLRFKRKARHYLQQTNTQPTVPLCAPKSCLWFDFPQAHPCSDSRRNTLRKTALGQYGSFLDTVGGSEKSLWCQGAPGEHGRSRPASVASLALGLVVALRFLGQQHGLDVGQDTALRDGHAAQQLVELFVVTDG